MRHRIARELKQDHRPKPAPAQMRGHPDKRARPDMKTDFGPNRRYFIIALIIVQALCTIFFVADVIADANGPAGFDVHLVIEAVASVVLVAAIALEFRQLLDLYRANQRFERSMRAASGALTDLIEEYFSSWGLTPAERDVATFTIKGMSIAEIASLRGSAEGTVKTQLNAIYRKAGVTGRGQLVSVLIEDLMAGALVPVDARDKDAAQAG